MQETQSQSPGPLPEQPSGAGTAVKTKAVVAAGAVAVGLLLLVAQLVRLQIVQAGFYERQAEQQQVLHRQLSAQRGRIFDCQGRLLATSVQRWSIYADPKGVKQPEAAASALSKALGVPRDHLLREFQKESSFAWVKRQVTDVEAQRVHDLDLDGIYMEQESKRLYPQGSLAAQVIGFTDIDGRGLAGMELEMDTLLRGRPGMESVLCDGSRRIFRSPEDVVTGKPFDGYDVQLTIDAYIQNIAEQELGKASDKYRPEAAAAVVLDAQDGSVLAMASWPSYNPQSPSDTPVANQRNVAICDAYEFGSVLKPVCISAALECGTVQPETKFDCHQGTWRIGSRTLHDAHGYGILTVSEIISHSSNIGAAQVGMLLGAKLLYSAVHGFGFGRDAGLALPGEAGGIVRPFSAWSNYSVVSVSFGQELAATPLAVARAFGVFASGGRLLQPRVVKSVTPYEEREPIYTAGPAVVNATPISEETASKMRDMLRLVVQEGTGTSAKLADYDVGGKTGTAQLLSPDGKTYSNNRFMSSFCGIAPINDPRIVVLVCMKAPSRSGYYGGTVAAPAAAQIIEQTLCYLKVPQVPKTEVALGGKP